MKLLKKIVLYHILLLLFNDTSLFAREAYAHNCLAPVRQKLSFLEMAKKEILDWKEANQNYLINHITKRVHFSRLLLRSYRILKRHQLHLLKPKERVEYAETIFENSNPLLTDSIQVIKKWINENPQFFNNGYLTPEGYHNLDKLYHKEIIEKKMLKDVNSKVLTALVFIIDKIIFNFNQGEKELLEILWLDSQLEKELREPGSGELPTIATISDLHGGAMRSIPMIAYVLGLGADNNITTVKELRKKLKEINFDAINTQIRVLAMSDIPDRGNFPAECHRLVEFLVDELHIGHFIIGNHDLWRTMGVLGVQKLDKFKDFFKNGKFIGPDELKSNHPAYWANEAIFHSGWASVEVDEMNQERLNKIIEKINDSYSLMAENRLDTIDIIKFRNTLDHEVKQIKEFNNEMRTQKRFDEIKEVPSLASATNKFLKDHIQSLNNKISSLNEEFAYDISKIDMDIVTVENYHLDPEVLRRVYWDLLNFNLFYIDPYGNLHFHSIPPIKTTIDADGNEIKSIDIDYKGSKGLKGMEAMQDKVKSFFSQTTPGDFVKIMQDPDKAIEFREKMWSEIGDIFSMVDSWYSDTKATAKLEAVQHFLEIGAHDTVKGFTKTRSSFSQRSARIGSGVIIGHNDVKKLIKDGVDWIQYILRKMFYLINTDGSMSEGYDLLGRITVQGRMPDAIVRGISNFGFSSKESTTIEDISESHFYSGKTDNLETMKYFQNTENWIKHQLRVHSAHLTPIISEILEKFEQTGNIGKYSFYFDFLKNNNYISADNSILKLNKEQATAA